MIRLASAAVAAGNALHGDITALTRHGVTQRASVQLRGTQAVSTVNLIRALGGGWGDAKPAPVPEPSLAQK